MRHVLFSFLLGILPLLNIAGQPTQHLRVTARYENRPLREVLEALTASEELRFSFLDKTVEGLTVDCIFEDADWEELEACLFSRNGIEVRVLGNGQIALRPDGLREWSVCFRVTSLSGEPLPFVSVSNLERGVAFVTDASGLLEAKLRLQPRDSLELNYLGYALKHVAPDAVSAEECPELKLKPASIELAAVTVTEYLSEGVSATTDGRRVILRPAAIAPAPGFADQEVFRDIARLPGINSLQESAGNLSIRGGTPDQHLVLWDNIPVYSSGHYLGMISNFSPDLIGAVNVWRGRAEAEYGGHVSGVIRMTTDPKIATRFSVGASLSLLQLQASTRIPLARDKSDLQLAFRGNLPGLLTGPAYESYRNQALQGYRVGETEGTVEDFTFSEFNGRWKYQMAKGHEFTLSAFRQDDDLDYRLSTNSDRTQFSDALISRNSGLSLHYAVQPKPSRRTEAWVTRTAFSNLGQNAFSNRITNTMALRSSGIRETSFKLMHTQEQQPGSRWQAGMQAQAFEYDFALEFENFITGRTRNATIRAGQAEVFSVFGSYAWEGGPFQLQAGLRLPYFSPTEKIYVEPRFSGSYHLGNSWRLKAGMGFNHQFPLQVLDFGQNRVSDSSPLWTLADGNIFPVLSGREISGGISASPGPWLLDVEAYYKRVNGLSSTALNLEAEGFNAGNARSRGIDLLARRRYGPWRTGAVYSLSRTSWFFPSLQPNSFASDFNRPHQLELEQAYRKGPWQISAAWQIQTGAPYTPAELGPPFIEDGTWTRELVFGPLNSRKLPNYQRMDVAISYEWPERPKDGWSGKVTLSLLNLLNQRNILERNFSREATDNPQPGEPRLTKVSIDRIGLGFTPNLSVRIGWE